MIVAFLVPHVVIRNSRCVVTISRKGWMDSILKVAYENIEMC